MAFPFSRRHRRKYGLFIILLMLLSACSTGNGSSSTGNAPTPGPTSGKDVATATPHVSPPGWVNMLPGWRVTDLSGEQGLVASAAQPGRIAGCALSAGLPPQEAVPTFVLSNDAGKTWQTRNIIGASATNSCTILADTQQRDTFVLESPDRMMITTNAGLTWTSLVSSSSVIPSYAYGLVGGHLFGFVVLQGSLNAHLAEIPISGGTWRILDANMPQGAVLDSQIPFAVDPDNSATIFAGVMLDQGERAVIATRNGGASWQVVQKLPDAHRIAIWTAHRHQVFVEQLNGKDTRYQLYYSKDDGVTWQGIGLHRKSGGESLYISPDGNIMSETGIDASTYNLFTLDPATGSFALQGAYALEPNMFVGVLVNGTAPALILADMFNTFALYLPK